MQKNEPTSHKQILKSTGIIGGEQAITVLAGVIRIKVVAVLLGPVGVGLAGLYQSSMDLIRNATGFGLGFSAVRDVAEAEATRDQAQVSRSILILRRWVWATGLLGTLIALVFSRYLSRSAFGDDRHTWQFALLSVTLLLGAVSAGQLGLLQGLRRIADLAKANIWGVIAGLVFSIPLYWIFGLDGVLYSMVLVAVASLFFSWTFARKVKMVPVSLTARETFRGGLGMAKLGFFMVLTSLLSTGTLYAVRLVISRKMGVDGVGQFQSAWMITSIYLGTVLNAMGADYFPRLSGISGDNRKVNTLVNEQAEVALLLAAPLIICMLVFGKWAVFTLYSGKFTQAVSILQWQICGTFFKILYWPIGFVFLAKRRTLVYVLFEVFWNVAYLLFILLGWQRLGIDVTGIGFVLAYVLVTLTAIPILGKLTGFRWSPRNVQLICIYLGCVLAAFWLSRNLQGVLGWTAGLLLVGTTTAISLHYLKGLVDIRLLLQKFVKR